VKTFRFSLALCGVAQVADLVSTRIALAREGVVEVNPVAEALQGSPVLWVAIKVGIAALCVSGALALPERHLKPIHTKVAVFMATLYGLVVANNLGGWL
jgi:hypothetical protein